MPFPSCSVWPGHSPAAAGAVPGATATVVRHLLAGSWVELAWFTRYAATCRPASAAERACLERRSTFEVSLRLTDTPMATAVSRLRTNITVIAIGRTMPSSPLIFARITRPPQFVFADSGSTLIDEISSGFFSLPPVTVAATVIRFARWVPAQAAQRSPVQVTKRCR